MEGDETSDQSPPRGYPKMTSSTNSQMQPMVLEDLPTKLGHFWGNSWKMVKIAMDDTCDHRTGGDI